jgi:hypothetical protein
MMRRAAEIPVANQPRRFAQKTGFGERRCVIGAGGTKIFSLPKTATQSPRNASSKRRGESQLHGVRAIRRS